MKNLSTQLIPATKADTATLLEMIGEYHAYDHLDFDAGKVEGFIEQIVTNESLGRLWLIHEEGQCIGYALLTFGFSFEFLGRDAFLDELFLREKFRGRGIGRQVLNEIQTLAPALGVKAIHLEIVKKNTAALKLYKNVGFVDHERFLMTWWDQKN